MENNQRIARAIASIKAIDPEYWTKTVNNRLNRPGSAGSVCLDHETPDELEKALLGAEWKEFTHPAIAEGCAAFSAPIRGLLGVVPLTELPTETLVSLDDRKNTGKVSAVIRGVLGEEVDYIVIILETENGVEIVTTFHPGEPVPTSKVQAEPGLHGKQVTVEEALSMGLATAKIT